MYSPSLIFRKMEDRTALFAKVAYIPTKNVGTYAPPANGTWQYIITKNDGKLTYNLP